MVNQKVLIIGLVWPEPLATAAGTRMLQLIHFFKDHGYELSFASTASRSDLSYDLNSLSVRCHHIELNHPSFDEFLKGLDPGMVVFDRFISEEQFGWRVEEICPNALRILDTEDLHFLRLARELALKADSLDWKQFIINDTTKREIASIYRSDLSLIISSFETKLLKNFFSIPESHLFYLPFLPKTLNIQQRDALPSFQERQNFMTIGNFRHKPNVDAALYLRRTIWPLIRKKLPNAELHVYGAYPSSAIQELNSPKEGFYIKGWIKEKKEAFIGARICLAPLRFGAGQKGKLLDAMLFGTPSITSTIGAEGMSENLEWNGYIEDKPEKFALKAIKLYQDQEVWERAQKNGFNSIENDYNKVYFESNLQKKLTQLFDTLADHRSSNFIGHMLNHHTMKSSKFLSKWIELKNLFNNNIIDK